MKNYYDEELNNVFPINSSIDSYGIQAQFISITGQTKFININKDSIKAIKRFINRIEKDINKQNKVLVKRFTK